ncbi:MFS transporter [Blautia sp. MSJ-19]|uniref:MFS transporter n=1 Tax=Blautia sp. MSJ-19 TaxID=2841517 RepID=UPI001C0F1EF7|nr:MFS transporter [Blautia sp. MSJ-19]MBU5481341.1 MFS transporter [Blautia sp. MSJ-19]
MSSVKQKNLTVFYSFIQGLYWMNFAAIMGYSGFYLLGSGFSNTEIGIIIAIAGILSAVLQPALASYADRPDSPSLKKFLQLLLILQLLLGVLLLFCQTVLLTGLVYGCGVTLLQLLTPFINALGMESINQGKSLNFGIARGMGSVAYAALSYVLGLITARTGITAVPVCITLITLVLLGCLTLFPFSKTPVSPVKTSSTKSSLNPLSFFIKYKRFTMVLIGCVFVYIGHVLLNSFTFQIVESKGGGSSEMGTAVAIAAMCELPTLFLFAHMVKKLRCDIWFRITGIFFTLKAFGTFLAPNMPVFYGIQVFQMLGWGLMAASSVYYVNAIMEPEDAIKGQAYIAMADK